MMEFETTTIHKLGICWPGSCGYRTEYEFYWSGSKEGLADRVAKRLLKCDLVGRAEIKKRARHTTGRALVVPCKFCPGGSPPSAIKFLDLDLLWGFAYPMEDLWDSEAEQAYLTFDDASEQDGYAFVDEVLKSHAFAVLLAEEKKRKEAEITAEKAAKARKAKADRRAQYEKLRKEFGDE